MPGGKTGKGKPPNGSELAVLWVESYAAEYDLDRVQFIVPDRRKAMLKRVQRVTGFNMARFLPWIMGHWPEFTEKVAREMGHKTRPTRPSIEYLVKNLDKAEELYRGRGAKKKKGGFTKYSVGDY